MLKGGKPLELRQAAHEPAQRLGTPLFVGESNLASQMSGWDAARMNRRRLETFLCDEARPVGPRGRKKQGVRSGLDLTACVECPSPCGYGMSYLERLTRQELKELSCGGDCLSCVQPCNLYGPMRGKERREINRFLRVALAGSQKK